MNIKSVQLEGAQLPQSLKDAIAGAGKDFAVCRITHGTKQVALVSVDWIPLIARLEQSAISTEELDRLFEHLVNSVDNPNDSCAVTEWARKLPLLS